MPNNYHLNTRQIRDLMPSIDRLSKKNPSGKFEEETLQYRGPESDHINIFGLVTHIRDQKRRELAIGTPHDMNVAFTVCLCRP